jgi:hypothetical protein
MKKNEHVKKIKREIEMEERKVRKKRNRRKQMRFVVVVSHRHRLSFGKLNMTIL